jgi:hypothetical protein
MTDLYWDPIAPELRDDPYPLWRRLRGEALPRDLSLIPGAVEEILRFESPSPVNACWTTRDVTLSGGRIPANSRVILVTGSAGRDERNPSPDVLGIHRRVDLHMTFGCASTSASERRWPVENHASVSRRPCVAGPNGPSIGPAPRCSTPAPSVAPFGCPSTSDRHDAGRPIRSEASRVARLETNTSRCLE